jgi:hypothetical protein
VDDEEAEAKGEEQNIDHETLEHQEPEELKR